MGGKQKNIEVRETHQLVDTSIGCLLRPPLPGPGIDPATEACGPDWNQTRDPSVCRLMFEPLSRLNRAHPSVIKEMVLKSSSVSTCPLSTLHQSSSLGRSLGLHFLGPLASWVSIGTMPVGITLRKHEHRREAAK